MRFNVFPISWLRCGMPVARHGETLQILRSFSPDSMGSVPATTLVTLVTLIQPHERHARPVIRPRTGNRNADRSAHGRVWICETSRSVTSLTLRVTICASHAIDTGESAMRIRFAILIAVSVLAGPIVFADEFPKVENTEKG